ncbi:MAG: hypothetical protein AAF696_05830 [Bacteroidota bacterium]
MKKSILILTAVLIGFSITTFAFVNWGGEEGKVEPKSVETLEKPAPIDYGVLTNFAGEEKIDFVYNIDARFTNRLSRERVREATSILELIPEKTMKLVKTIQNVKVAILKGEDEISELGDSNELTQAQKKLLQRVQYSDNILLYADYKQEIVGSEDLANNYFSYYISIVPEQEAEYEAGMEVLLNYLITNSEEERKAVSLKEVKSGRIDFRVNKAGKIDQVKLDSSSAYDELDGKMLDLIKNMPGKWKTAKNSKGEKIGQEFVFFFGSRAC